jgi:hypothetical protein
MNVLDYIIENWDFLLLIAAAIVAVGFSVYRGNKSVVMKMLYALVTEAEKEYGGGTGSLKLAAVITAVYPKLPAVVKLFVTEKTLTAWVEEALTKAKEAWEKNAALAEYIAKPAEVVTEAVPEAAPDTVPEEIQPEEAPENCQVCDDSEDCESWYGGTGCKYNGQIVPPDAEPVNPVADTFMRDSYE